MNDQAKRILYTSTILIIAAELQTFIQFLPKMYMNIFSIFVIFSLMTLLYADFVTRLKWLQKSAGVIAGMSVWIIYGAVYSETSYTINILWIQILHDVLLVLVIIVRLVISPHFFLKKKKTIQRGCFFVYIILITLPFANASLPLMSQVMTFVRLFNSMIVFVTCEACKKYIKDEFKPWNETLFILFSYNFYVTIYAMIVGIVIYIIILFKTCNMKQIYQNAIHQLNPKHSVIHEEHDILNQDDIKTEIDMEITEDSYKMEEYPPTDTPETTVFTVSDNLDNQQQRNETIPLEEPMIYDSLNKDDYTLADFNDFMKSKNYYTTTEKKVTEEVVTQEDLELLQSFLD